MTKTCWEMWGSESKLHSLLFSLTAGSFCNHRQYVLNLLVIWKTENSSFYNCSGSLPFQTAIIKNIQDILLSTSFGEKKKSNIYNLRRKGNFSSVFVSPTVCVCKCWCVYLHGGSPLGWDLLLVMGDIDFFFSPPSVFSGILTES